MHGAVARHYRPEDMRIGTLAGALDQLDPGTTTLADPPITGWAAGLSGGARP